MTVNINPVVTRFARYEWTIPAGASEDEAKQQIDIAKIWAEGHDIELCRWEMENGKILLFFVKETG